MKQPGCFFFAFFGIWTAATLFLDGSFVLGVYRQSRAAAFPSTPGVVTESKVTSSTDSEGGTTYSSHVIYTFTVNGKPYTSHRQRFTAENGTLDAVTRYVAAHPAGTNVTVYYDPVDPSMAVLTPQMRGFDLFPAVFSLPFNAVMLVGWMMLPRMRKGWIGGLRTWREGGVIRARMRPPEAAWLAGIGVMGGVGFVAVFVLAFSPLRDLWFAVGTALLGSIGGGLFTTWQMLRSIHRGEHDLVVDPARGLFMWRTEEVRFADVASVGLRVISDGDDGPNAWAVEMHRRSNGSLRLCRTSDKARADAIVAWIQGLVQLASGATTE